MTSKITKERQGKRRGRGGKATGRVLPAIRGIEPKAGERLVLGSLSFSQSIEKSWPGTRKKELLSTRGSRGEKVGPERTDHWRAWKSLRGEGRKERTQGKKKGKATKGLMVHFNGTNTGRKNRIKVKSVDL